MGNSAPIQYPSIINSLPIKPSSDILNSKFNNNILDILVPNLVLNFNKFELLNHKV